MTEDIFKGQWKQLKGNVKKQWGKLTDDEMDEIEGNKDILIGKLQEKYGYTKEQARLEVDNWMRENNINRF
jgi:uncharacterized protein YjbJ (UPF0337 family)